MIPQIQLYKNSPSYCAKVPNRKLTIVCDDGKKIVVDKFISKQKGKSSDTIADTIKNMFFEIFPNLDNEYKKMFSHHKGRV